MSLDRAIAFAAVLAVTAALAIGAPGWLLTQEVWVGPLSNGLVALAGLYSLSVLLLAAWYETFSRSRDRWTRAEDLRTFSSLLPPPLFLGLAAGLILRAALTFAPLLASPLAAD